MGLMSTSGLHRVEINRHLRQMPHTSFVEISITSDNKNACTDTVDKEDSADDEIGVWHSR